jgi:predicted ester cyclase
MSKVEIARKGFEQLEASDFEAARASLADGFEFSGPVPEPVGAEAWLGLQKKLLTAFPDWAFNIEDLREEGDKVHCTVQISGTHKGALELPPDIGVPSIPATGKSIRLVREKVELTFKGDKIASIRSAATPGAGVPGILSQLGVKMPA